MLGCGVACVFNIFFGYFKWLVYMWIVHGAVLCTHFSPPMDSPHHQLKILCSFRNIASPTSWEQIQCVRRIVLRVIVGGGCSMKMGTLPLIGEHLLGVTMWLKKCIPPLYFSIALNTSIHVLHSAIYSVELSLPIVALAVSQFCMGGVVDYRKIGTISLLVPPNHPSTECNWLGQEINNSLHIREHMLVLDLSSYKGFKGGNCKWGGSGDWSGSRLQVIVTPTRAQCLSPHLWMIDNPYQFLVNPLPIRAQMKCMDPKNSK